MKPGQGAKVASVAPVIDSDLNGGAEVALDAEGLEPEEDDDVVDGDVADGDPGVHSPHHGDH
jgi:hypothetical protein